MMGKRIQKNRILDSANKTNLYPVRNNAPLLCSGVRCYNNSGGG